jgi:hypothetical protein
VSETYREAARRLLDHADSISGDATRELYPLVIALTGIGYAVLDAADSIDRLPRDA